MDCSSRSRRRHREQELPLLDPHSPGSDDRRFAGFGPDIPAVASMGIDLTAATPPSRLYEEDKSLVLHRDAAAHRTNGAMHDRRTLYGRENTEAYADHRHARTQITHADDADNKDSIYLAPIPPRAAAATTMHMATTMDMAPHCSTPNGSDPHHQGASMIESRYDRLITMYGGLNYDESSTTTMDYSRQFADDAHQQQQNAADLRIVAEARERMMRAGCELDEALRAEERHQRTGRAAAMPLQPLRRPSFAPGHDDEKHAAVSKRSFSEPTPEHDWAVAPQQKRARMSNDGPSYGTSEIDAASPTKHHHHRVVISPSESAVLLPPSSSRMAPPYDGSPLGMPNQQQQKGLPPSFSSRMASSSAASAIRHQHRNGAPFTSSLPLVLPTTGAFNPGFAAQPIVVTATSQRQHHRHPLLAQPTTHAAALLPPGREAEELQRRAKMMPPPLQRMPSETRHLETQPSPKDTPSGMDASLLSASSSSSFSASSTSVNGDDDREEASDSELATKETSNSNQKNTTKDAAGHDGDKTGKKVKKYYTAQRSERWNAMLRDLESFRSVHGHCVVPRGYDDNYKLALWVSEQRKQRRLRDLGRQSNLTDERRAALDRLGFVWNAQEAAWSRNLANLEQFKARHGHALVPQKCTEFPGLGMWVKEQRRHYGLVSKNKNDGEEEGGDGGGGAKLDSGANKMHPERIEILRKIGFVFDYVEASWWESYGELQTFRTRHGHCRVPYKVAGNSKLGSWVRHQRILYKKSREGKETSLTSDRVYAMERLDFEWTNSEGE